MIYIIVFIISFLLSIVVNKVSKKSKILGNVLLFVLILFLSIFGGIRNFEIGTDVEVYGVKWFNYACLYSDFSSYVSIIKSSDVGYLLLNFIVSRISHNPSFFLFVVQLITNSLIIITLYKYRDKINFPISLLLFLCIFYCRFFNILRQSIALAICFYSFSFLDKDKNVKFVILSIIASFFHFTAIFNLILLLIKLICKLNGKKKYFLLFMVFISTLFMTFYIEQTISILYKYGIVNFRIFNYLNRYSNSGSYVSFESIFKFLIITFMIFNNKTLVKKYNSFDFLMYCTILEFLLFQIRRVILYADRISLYFGVLLMISYPFSVRNCTLSKQKKMIIYLVSFILLFTYWYYVFVYKGSCEVYPFKFYWNN